MNNLKERIGASDMALLKPMIVARRRRRMYPLFLHMGPVALCITSVLLIALMAVLYLSQLGQAVTANQQLQDIHAQQATLQRQNQDLMDTIALEQSPGYIADNAKKLGLVPAEPKLVQVVPVPNLRPIQDNGHIQP